MTIIKNETTDIDFHYCELTHEIQALKAERFKEGKALRSAGIEADEEIKAELETAVKEARKVVQGLNVSLATAERRKADLDKRIDTGDDTVSPLEVVEADMAIRTTKGKLTPADATLRRAERALEPFLADDHLSLLVADTIYPDVPTLIRKRASDVHGFSDAIVLSQIEPTECYGTASPSGRVRFTEIGTTGLDLEALEAALRATGSEVQVHPGLIDFEVALWPVPRLKSPSQDEVVRFADLAARAFQATVEGPTANRSYSTYSTLWETTEASLEITEPGKTSGKVVANIGVDRERPPLEQMHQFITQTLSYFEPGVHTSAGVLDGITVTELLDAGPWVPDGQPYIHNRSYPQRFIVTISLDYSYEPVEEV
jgi:hypothetical protein